MATVTIVFKDLRAACVALNEFKIGEVPLIPEPIKLVGVTKEDVLKKFMENMAAVPDDAEGKFPGPKLALDFYNSVLDAEEKASQGKTEVPGTAAGAGKEVKPPKAPGEPKPPKTPKNNEKKDFIAGLITEGKYTKKEIVEKALAQFPDMAASSVVTMISDGKNVKYNKFASLVVIGEDGIVKFAPAAK